MQLQPMMLILKRKTVLPISITYFPSLLRFWSSSSSSTSTSHKSQFVEKYLIESCGFSPERAAVASKYMNFTSPDQPDSVKHFLEHNVGVTDANIRSIISREVRILNSDVSKTMKPNLEALRKISSWSSSDLHNLIIFSPSLLIYPHAMPRLMFWKDFLNGDMKKLVRAVRRNLGLFSLDLNTGTTSQKTKLLNDYGFSNDDIQLILVRGCGIFCRTTASLKALLERVDEFGFARGSPAFMQGLFALCHSGLDIVNVKMKCFRRCGWSESEFLAAFLKYPAIVGLSEKNIKDKMDFLVETAGFKHSDITARPILLTFSLEKRMVPRLQVMNILTSLNLFRSRMGIFSFISISERKFLENYVLLHKDKVPDLHDIYTAACAGQIHL